MKKEKMLYAYAGALGSGKWYCASKEIEKLKTTGHTIFLTSFADPIKQILKAAFGFTKEGRIYARGSFSAAYVKDQVVESLFYYIKDLDCKFSKKSEYVIKSDIADNYDHYAAEFVSNVNICAAETVSEADYNHYFRRLGQLLGTELGRSVLDTIWIDIALMKVKEVFDQDLADYAVLDDCRFLNEYDSLVEFEKYTGYKAKVIGIKASYATRARRRELSEEIMKIQDSHGSEREIHLIIEQLPEEDVIINEG